MRTLVARGSEPPLAADAISVRLARQARHHDALRHAALVCRARDDRAGAALCTRRLAELRAKRPAR